MKSWELQKTCEEEENLKNWKREEVMKRCRRGGGGIHLVKGGGWRKGGVSISNSPFLPLASLPHSRATLCRALVPLLQSQRTQRTDQNQAKPDYGGSCDWNIACPRLYHHHPTLAVSHRQWRRSPPQCASVSTNVQSGSGHSSGDQAAMEEKRAEVGV